MVTLPSGYELITRGRTSIAVQERYRDALLAQGIGNPEQLVRCAAGQESPSGRGAVPALPINGFPEERMMIRRCLRGGLMRFINSDLYLDAERSFRELAITVEAGRCGVPTVEVLAAVSIKAAGALHRCFLVSRQLPGCIDLPAYLHSRAATGTFKKDKSAVLERAAAAVRLMHDKGFFHADLNMKNILVDTAGPERLFIIDWDKSRRFGRLSDARRMSNAVRFCRSMKKLAEKGLPVENEDAQVFLSAYRSDTQFVQTCLEQLRRTVAVRRKFWKLLGQ